MRVRTENGKEQVWCAWRRKYVRLTPEEYVRQTILREMVDERGYPASLIAVEVAIPTPPEMPAKRADAIIYNRQMQPMMLMEFKADTVALTQRTLDQAAVYNRLIGAPYLILSNGRESIAARVEENTIAFMKNIPLWTEL